MKVAIHQPEYWPLPKLLAKWRAADLLILLDIVQFDRSSLQHRCRLLDGTQPRVLTIDYRHAGSQQIRMVEAAHSDWPRLHWNRVAQWYWGAPADRLRGVQRWFEGLIPDEAVSYYAWESMRYLAEDLCGLTMPEVVPASSLMPPQGGWGEKGYLVRDLCLTVGASSYLSGQSGARYLGGAAGESYRSGSGAVDDWAPVLEAVGIHMEVQHYTAQAEAEQMLSGLHVYLTSGPDALRRLVEPAS